MMGWGLLHLHPPQSRHTQGWRPMAGAAGALGRQVHRTLWDTWENPPPSAHHTDSHIPQALPLTGQVTARGPRPTAPGRGTCGTLSLIPPRLWRDTTRSPVGRWGATESGWLGSDTATSLRPASVSPATPSHPSRLQGVWPLPTTQKRRQLC